MKYKNKRLLYIVQHSNKEMFKIGICTNNNRFNDLNRDYSINWKNSFYFEGENLDILKLEKILHNGFYRYNLDKQNGTGGTEWFSIECLAAVIETISSQVPLFDFQINLKFKNIELHSTNDIIQKSNLIETKDKSWTERKQEILNKYPSEIVDKWNALDNLNPTQKRVDKMNNLIPEFRIMLKPSELTQVVFIQQVKKDLTIYKMSPLQIDLINSLIYKVREQIIKNSMELDDSIPSTLFEFNISEISSMLPKYNNNEYGEIIRQLDALSDVKIVINSLGKNKEIDEMIITRFIHEMRISRHRQQGKKKIKLAISNTIINRFIHVKKYFSKMFFSIQFSMKSKYSKLLYEIVKDYEKLNVLVVSFENLTELLNVTEDSQKKWSVFRANILKKAVDEINSRSDITVDYEPIKEKPEGQRLQVTKIKFFISKQPKARLQELGLIKESITTNQFYNKSKSKLDKLIKNGYKVIDEDIWIKTDIGKNEELYDTQTKLDDYFKEISKLSNDDKYNLQSALAIYLNSDDPIVLFDTEKYIINDLSGNILTKNAIETRKVILEYQDLEKN